MTKKPKISPAYIGAIFSNKLASNKKIAFGIVFILVIFLIILASPARNQILNFISGEKVNNEGEVEALLKEVGEKILLPTDEKPTVATISDITKLENQPFFRGAKNGDKLIIYAGVRKAILYRPEIKKIIEISTISDSGYEQETADSTNTTEPNLTPTPISEPKVIKVVILNGTKESGLARKASELIESETVEVVSTGNSKEDYKTTSISSINASANLSKNDLTDLLKGFNNVSPKTIDFPSAETQPANADVVLILGEDFADQY